MNISIFDLLQISIGPSSSHTIGPMRAAGYFMEHYEKYHKLAHVHTITIELFGALAHTGEGHGTVPAVLLGLEGQTPETITPKYLKKRFKKITETQTLKLPNHHAVKFDLKKHLVFNYIDILPKHSNALRFSVYNKDKKLLTQKVYYSVGGGFVIDGAKSTRQQNNVILFALSHPFASAKELFQQCKKLKCSIAKIMLDNEQAWRTKKNIKHQLAHIAEVMEQSIDRGCSRKNLTLPGGLKVARRAPLLYKNLPQKLRRVRKHPSKLTNWVQMCAFAVAEENASGGCVVTAPTNGSAGVLPAVLHYYRKFHKGVNKNKINEFLLTAGAIGLLYKTNASISGAEVGCQGEIGVACSMAAGALTTVLGGTLQQIENAAEIAMEHHLGLTCDPIAGLVQIPCIERNAVAAAKAISVAHLALVEDRKPHISLDQVILTMKETGLDMMAKYKETSKGGLASSIRS
ncbi:MAG: L-serine ammonia-lyase [Gammaproteobacteria bacterium RIFCSPLOWO2_02_FULL_42_9]|nr:MAG: L-serine ammonia-lyase [Gammaproteobacteria bacterium RIFCSPLOWO2_02_FULL_42_9]